MDDEVRGAGLDGRLAQLLVGRLVERIDPLAAFLYIPVDHIDEVQKLQFDVLDGFDADAVELDPTEPENLHITLLYIDKVKDDDLEEFFNAVNLIMPVAFEVTVSHTGTFPEADTKPVIAHIAPSPALIRLQNELYNTAFSMGLPLSVFSKPENFKPHISLAYGLEPPNAAIPDMAQPLQIPIDRFQATRPEYELVRTIWLPTFRKEDVLVTQTDGPNPEGPEGPPSPPRLGGSIPKGATTQAEDRRQLKDSVERPVGPDKELNIRILYDPNLEKEAQSVNTFDTFDITLGPPYYEAGDVERAGILARSLGQDLARRLLLGPGGAHEWQRADAMMAAPPDEVEAGYRFVFANNSLADAIADTYAVLSVNPAEIGQRNYWNASDWIGMAVTEQPQFDPAQLPDLDELVARIAEEPVFPGVTLIVDEREERKPSLEEMQEEEDEEGQATGTASEDGDFGVSKSDLLHLLRGGSLTYGPLRRTLVLEDGPFVVLDDGSPVERIAPPDPAEFRHEGPGEHPGTGSPQQAHAGDRGAEGEFDPKSIERGDPMPGQCFECSARWLILEQGVEFENARLVHGTVAGRGIREGERFTHGWIEIEDAWVYDRAQDILTPKANYYNLAQVEDMVSYTADEVRINLLKSEHWGPWDEFLLEFEEEDIDFEGGIILDSRDRDLYDIVPDEKAKPLTAEELDQIAEMQAGLRERIAAILRRFVVGALRLVGRHEGPGEHPGTGTEQQAHAGDGGAESVDEGPGQPLKTEPRMVKSRWRYKSSLEHDAQAISTNEGVDIHIGPKFWKLPDEGAKKFVLAHEFGHELADRFAMTGGDAFDKAMKALAAPSKEASEHNRFVFGNPDLLEAAADLYAVYIINPDELDERGYDKAREWIEEAIRTNPAFSKANAPDFGEILAELGPEPPELEGISTLTERHEGPGEHPGTGSPQQAHAGDRAAGDRPSIDGLMDRAEANGLNVAIRPDEMIELQAAVYEREYGWDEEHTREGFVKRWTEILEGTEPDPEFVEDVLEGIVIAREQGIIPEGVGLVIRRWSRERESEEWAQARWNGYILVLQSRFAEDAEGIAQGRRLQTESRIGVDGMADADEIGSVTDLYENYWTGVAAHEYGHEIEGQLMKSGSGATRRALNLIANEPNRVKRWLSEYGLNAAHELIAEAYAARQHPRFDEMPDETKALVDEILGEDV
jgi:2'-5' RNA ligase